VRPEIVVKLLVCPFTNEIEVHFSEGGQESVRVNALPRISIVKSEAKTIKKGEWPDRYAYGKESPGMDPCHGIALAIVKKNFSRFRVRMECPDDNGPPTRGFNRMGA
jgi:hypothetical protein